MKVCQRCGDRFNAPGVQKHCDPCATAKAKTKVCDCGAEYEVGKRGGQPTKCEGCRQARTYVLTLSCGRCGGPTRLVTERAQPGARVAILKCRSCLEEMILRAQVVMAKEIQFGNKPEPICGTAGGYQYHLRHGSKPCNSCRQAHSLQNAMRAERRAG